MELVPLIEKVRVINMSVSSCMVPFQAEIKYMLICDN